MAFLKPNLLYLLPLALLPILIHLLSRLRIRTISFPTLRFLYPEEKTRFHWFRLRDLLLLIVRSILIGLLVLIMAQPKTKGMITRPIRLIIDDSYRMEPLLSKSRDRAIELIDQYQVDELRLLSRDDGLRAPPRELKRRLGRINCSFLSPKLRGMGEDMVNVLITDLALPILPSSPIPDTIWYIDVGRHTANLQVDLVTTTDPVVMAGMRNRIRARVRNRGDRSTETRIKLFCGGREEEHQILIPERGCHTVDFGIGFSNIGVYPGWVEIDADSIRGDNRRYFVLQIPARVQIGIFFQDSTGLGYLRTGLEVGPYDFEILRFDRLAKIDPDRFELIIFYNPITLKRWQRRLIEAWINHSKGMIFFLGREPDAQVDSLLSPFVHGFTLQKGFGYKAVDRFRVYRYLEVQKLKGEVLVPIGNDPLVLREKNLILVMTDLDLSATDLPLRNNFIPFLYHLIALLVPGGIEDHRVGIPIRCADHDVIVTTPEGDRLAPNGVFQPKIPGIYRYHDRLWAVNVDPEGGMIEEIPERIRKDFHLLPFPKQGGRDLTPYLISAFLLLLLIELLIAHTGSGRSKSESRSR